MIDRQPVKVREQSGVELQRTALDMVDGDLRPLGDRIVVRPLPLKLSQTILAAWRGRAVRGLVVAVGPGEYPRRYNKDRSRTWRSATFRPTEVKVGDLVELGGLEINGYDFPRVLLSGVEHIIASEKDVCGFTENA